MQLEVKQYASCQLCLTFTRLGIKAVHKHCFLFTYTYATTNITTKRNKNTDLILDFFFLLSNVIIESWNIYMLTKLLSKI